MYLDEKTALEKFAGTGSKNNAGQDLIEFLKEYDPDKYKNPCNTVDTLIFTYGEAQGRKVIKKVLLIKRGNHPSIGWWALPGGFVEYGEDINTAALRELQEETGIENIDVVQLKTYGAVDRDPRTRIITTAFVALVPEGSLKAKAGDDASASGWFDIKDICLDKGANTNGDIYEKHKLVLKNEAAGVQTETTVNMAWNEHRILQEKTYTVEQTKLLAADHGAIILEGYHRAIACI